MPTKVFSIHPDNPRCFLYQGKPFKILTSAEHYGAVLNADLNYDLYLREMQRTGQNMTRVFTFYRETPDCIPAPGHMNTLAPSPEASVMPWERVPGRGKASDGLDKFDLNRWNVAYFERLKDYVGKCAERGVVCEIVLFCQPYDQRKYDLFPCSEVSNINGVGCDLKDRRYFLTLEAPSIVAFQERFVRRIVRELNPFDNVYYEICNEPGMRNIQDGKTERKVVAWHAHLARLIRQTEETLGKRHLIAANAHFVVSGSDEDLPPVIRHEDASYFENPDIDIVNYHYISAKFATEGLHFRRLPQAHAGYIWRFLRQRDQFRKPIVFDETFSGIVRGQPEQYAINRAEAWEMILAGGAGYDNLDWSFTPADETGSGKAPIADGRRLDGRSLREWLDVLRRLLSRSDLSALVPAVGLLPQRIPGYGYAASTDGEGRYVLYIVDERLYLFKECESRPLSVLLNLPPGEYSVQSFEPRSGVTLTLPPLQSRGSARLDVPPFMEDTAILLALSGRRRRTN